jgi:lipid-A-disaccharide synthase
MFVAGENSADQHASRLISELKSQVPTLECFGYGGSQMEKAGMRLDFNLAEDLPVIGITQALTHYPEIRRLFRRACDMLQSERPDAVVLVDYPGFNLRLAREASRLGIPVIYFIAPQVWAWHASRIKEIARTVSLLLVIFPFEEPLFQQAGVETWYVGHPLLDAPPPARTRAEVLSALGIDQQATVIGLIPGSRRGELDHHLVLVLDAARAISHELPSAAFVIPRAHTVDGNRIQQALAAYPDLRVAVAEEDHVSVRAALDFAVCKSGTSTLELALAGVPMVVIYRVSLPTYLFARAVIRMPWISLVNIVAGERLVPELLQYDATPERVAGAVLELLRSPESLARIREGYSRIRGSFGEGGCARRAAARILDFFARRYAAGPKNN